VCPAVLRTGRATRRASVAGLLVVAVALLPLSDRIDPASAAPVATSAAGPPAAGYWLATTYGQVFGYGTVASRSSPAITPLAQPVVCMSSTANGLGYWEVASDGGIFSFGDAPFLGSLGARRLDEPIVGMSPTPTGRGYWLVASDGGIFAFGDARFFGSLGGVRLAQPIVGMTPTPTGRGYWLVASDGGIFAFGDARFFGSLGGVRLAQPIVGMTPTPTGRGYWMVATDGGLFAFGDAGFHGSLGAVHLTEPIVGMSSTPSGQGYWMAGRDGGVFSFGDARYAGSAFGATTTPVVAIDRPGQAGGCQGATTPAPPARPGPGGPAGEGQWVPFSRDVGSTTAAYVTTIRPEVGIPAATVVWIDTTRTRFRQYAGAAGEPPGTYRYATAVGGTDLNSLVAAFNGGFKTADSKGGWYSEGQMPYPLVAGAASLVIDAYGTPRVGEWGRDFTSLAGVVSVRQNLTLLVDHGAPSADIDVGADWGPVIGGVGNTCRSGIGIDRFGNLLYVAGPTLFPIDLAHALIRAGAVEGMEFDINCQWPIITGFLAGPGQAASVANAYKAAAWMAFPRTQFLTGSQKDFVAVFSR
jgi:hypothetical protein